MYTAEVVEKKTFYDDVGIIDDDDDEGTCTFIFCTMFPFLRQHIHSHSLNNFSAQMHGDIVITCSTTCKCLITPVSVVSDIVFVHLLSSILFDILLLSFIMP